MLMYRDGRLLRVKRKKARGLSPSRALCICCHSSSAGRGALLALHPLLEGGFRVADCAAQLDVGRAVAGEPPLGQPGHAEVQVPRRLFRGQQDRRRGRPVGRRRTARAGSFGEHWMWSLGWSGVLPPQLLNKLGNHLPTRGTFRVGPMHKTTSSRGRVLSMLLPEPLFAALQAFAASLGAWRKHLWIQKSLKGLCGVEKPANPCT